MNELEGEPAVEPGTGANRCWPQGPGSIPTSSAEWMQAWQRAVSRVMMRPHWRYPVRTDVRWSDYVDGVEVRLSISALDVERPPDEAPPIDVHQSEWVNFRDWRCQDEVGMVRLLVRLHRAIVEHEFNECLLVDGMPLVDAHRRIQ